MAAIGYGSVKRRKANPAEPMVKSPVKSADTCSEDECRFCDFIETSHWDSSSAPSPASAITADCALCLPEQALGACEAVDAGGTKKLSKSLSQQFPVCEDPECPEGLCDDCPEDVCDECSVAAKDCEECVEECGPSCTGFAPAEAEGRPTTGYSFFDSYDMFAGPSAQPSDYGSRLTHLHSGLPRDSFAIPNPYSYHPHTHMSTFHDPGQSKSLIAGWKRPYDEYELSRVLVDLSASTNLLDSVGTNFQNDLPQSHTVDLSLGGDWMGASQMHINTSNAGALPHPVVSEALPYSASPQTFLGYPETPPSRQANPSKSRNGAREKLDAVSEGPAMKDSEEEPMVCTWADANGHPCGQIICHGTAMHEHLKSIHHTRTAIECRWLGCRVSASGPNPHKFANSVERHTWGHSGHRPYRCSACFMGFAAAAVRDEHYANFHLGCKNYECEVCRHRCSSARNLKRHKDEKHSAERYQCEFCHKQGKQRLFPRGSNLARHFRKCRAVLDRFPGARGAAEGKIFDDWFPPGYKGGPQGMDKAKVVAPA